MSSPATTMSKSSSPQQPSSSSLSHNENPNYYQQLTICRNELKDTGLYLGDPSTDIREIVEWKRFGRCQQLVTKIIGNNDNETCGSNMKDIQHAPASTIPHSTQAILHAIVTISANDCFLTPCGSWRGPTATAKSFTDAKLSFRGEDPNQDTIRKDFEMVIQNAKRLMDDVATENVQRKGFLNFIGTKGGLRFRHVLFEVSDNDNMESYFCSNSLSSNIGKRRITTTILKLKASVISLMNGQR